MKTSRKKTAVIVIILILLGTYLYPGGKHVASYTRLKVDARALAMGGAFTSAADGIESIFYNPAGLMYSNGIEMGSMFSSGMAFDRTYSFAGITSRLNTKTDQAIGIAGVSAKMDGIPRYAPGSDVSSGDFSVDETCVLFSYASYDDRVNSYWGTTIKLFNSSVDSDSKTGVGIDFGIMVDPSDRFRLGIIARDIYSKVGTEQISPSLSVGLSTHSSSISKQALDSGLMATIDAGYIFDGESGVQYSGGFEYYMKYNEKITLAPRCGLNNNSVTVGFGLAVSLFQLDYAYIPKPNDQFNDSQRISLTLIF